MFWFEADFCCAKIHCQIFNPEFQSRKLLCVAKACISVSKTKTKHLFKDLECGVMLKKRKKKKHRMVKGQHEIW